MRILHAIATFAPAWQYGGPVRSTFELCRALAVQGHRVCVITTTAGTPHAGSSSVVRAHVEGIDVHYCPAQVGRLGIHSRTMASVVRDLAPEADVAHLTGVWQPTSRGVAASFIRAGLPYVSSPRGALSPYSFSQGRLKKRIYYATVERRIQRDAAAIHATAPLEAEEVRRLGLGVPVRVAPNICPAETWHPDPDAGRAWRERHGIPDDMLVVAHVGRVQAKKNLEFLAQVAERVRAGRRWIMVLCGPVAARDAGYLRTLRSRFPAGTLAVIPGSADTTEVRGAYCGSDCMAMPSLHENFGNAAVEAALCGTHVLASPFVGAAGILEPHGAATVLPLQADEWARTIEARGTGRCERRLHRDAIARQVGPEAVAAQMAEFYREAADRRQCR